MINSVQKEITVEHLRQIRPKKIGVFGSFARHENVKDSDLDILVYIDNDNKISLLDLLSVEQELSNVLGIKVDLVTERSLNPLVRPYVEKDLQIIFFQ